MNARRAIAVALTVLVGSIAGVAIVPSAGAARGKSTVEFRAVLAELSPAAATSTTRSPANRVEAALAVASCDVAAVQQLPAVPTTKWRTAKPEECVVYPALTGGTGAARYFLGPAKVTTAGIERARARFTAGQGWTVHLDLTNAGSRAWDDLAEQQFHQQVAITASGTVVSAPTIQPNDATFTSFDGSAVISGDFTRKQAEGLAVLAAPNHR